MTVTAEISTSIDELIEALRSARRVTALCHENPDADTIGAAVAMSLIAERLGAETEIVSADGIPPMFAYLPKIDTVRPRPELEPDLAVVCDAATLERVGRIAQQEADWFAGARLVNVDHHISNTRYGHINVIDPHASATCEVVARLVEQLALPLDAELATPLLTGIVRDSHGFADRSTSGDTLRIAAALVDAGAPLAMIQRVILAELPYPTMALWGKMLATIGQEADARIVHTTLTLDMVAETGTEQHDADGLAEFLANVKGADVTLLLRELGPAETRVSVRTSKAVDATRVVAPFGGGGHRSRAGATVWLPWQEARTAVLHASRAALEDGDR
ncbi:MAG TPA: bifunctional oligoribonuclease/PAP phosphatase NrnA [Candidatus Limnocylindria bacterium]|nr:bifunctional oligoribonuclease/PAP phosphatase NrnA [Candidatus Limnocylindria bacterium]